MSLSVQGLREKSKEVSSYLESVVGESIKVRSREEVEGVLRRHTHIPIINVSEKAVECLFRGHHLPNHNLSTNISLC